MNSPIHFYNLEKKMSYGKYNLKPRNMSTSEEIKIFEHIQELGCCTPCCLRYLCDKCLDFSDVDGILEKKKLSRKTEEGEESPVKRAKANPCCVCLGLLQDVALNDLLKHEDVFKAAVYDSPTFSVSISMPACILIRERAMRLHLEEKFPLFFTDDNIEIPLNRVWKMYVKNPMAERIGKTFEQSDVCDFFLNVSTHYDQDDEEVAVLKEMQPKMFETRKLQHRKYNGEVFSRNGVVAALAQTPRKLFALYATVPPEVPSNHLTCKGVECKHNSTYIAGRYCKYSRELSQSPWIIEGVKAMETSVQEIIFHSVKDSFGIPEENMKFSSSGREDCDVRCLGKGRPFYIEFMDPKKTEFTFQEFRDLEKSVNSSPLIKVTDLQKVKRSELVQIKDGEESKTKSYVALCVTSRPVTGEMLDAINNHGPVEISQKTPVRVLHRRPLAVRTRKIEQMTATAVTGHLNCFELRVITQAGTYVKEFVHGDFDRTRPNIGEIIKCEVDIAALDVVSINLDWPEPIQY